MEDQEQRAHEMIRSVYEDGKAEINGRFYVLHKMKHKQRRKVFAFYSKVAPKVKQGDLSFLDSPEFEEVESVINNAVTIDDSLLAKIEDRHWDEHPEDYIPFISTMLPVISYPFMAGGHTG